MIPINLVHTFSDLTKNRIVFRIKIINFLKNDHKHKGSKENGSKLNTQKQVSKLVIIV